MTFDLEFSWANGCPSATGNIRAEVAHFKVFEQSIDATGSGEHAYLRICKKETNTHWVAEKIAEVAGVDVKDVGFGGRKDRYSVSEQAFTCYLPGRSDPDWSRLDGPEVKVLKVDRTQKKLRKGDLWGNAFEICLTQVSNRLDDRLQPMVNASVPNYFGEQRFGQNCRNLSAAQELVKRPHGRFHSRDMILSAMRAYLFNLYLSNYIDTHRGCSRDLNAMGPLYGRSRDPQGGEAELSDELQQWVTTLRQLRLKAGVRKLWLVPLEFDWHRDDNNYLLRFTLPPGSYATSVLREVLRYKDERRGG